MLKLILALLVASPSPLRLCGPDKPLAPLLEEANALAVVLERASEHRLQISVAEVREDCLQRYTYRVGQEYFYPASSIKLLGAVSAVQWQESQSKVNLDTPLIVERSSIVVAGDRLEVSSQTEPQPLRETLDETLVVSSNSGFNRLYDIAGQDALNSPYWNAGFKSVRLRHRLSSRGFPRVIQQVAPPIRLTRGKRLSPMRRSNLAFKQNPGARAFAGSAHIDPVSGDTVNKPLPFEDRNAIDLFDLQGVLVNVVHPRLVHQPLTLSAEGRAALRGILAKQVADPPEAGAPEDRIKYKPLLAGFRRGLSSPVHFENKAGRAYGFQVDNAYVRDSKSGRELFVAATLYINANGVVGDDQYEYDTTGLGFLENLGETLARHWFATP